MKLVRHIIQNFMGIDTFRLEPGPIAILCGGNGLGKTSILESFRSLAEGGKDPDSIKKGEDEAVIKSVWEVEEGDNPEYEPGRYEITRTIKADGYSLQVKGPNGKKIPKEKTFVDTFMPRIGFDPLAFDKLNDEQRAEKLRKFLTVKVTAEEIRTAAKLVNLPPMAQKEFEDGIVQIDSTVAMLKTKASELRAVIKDRTGSINTFEESIGDATAESVEKELRDARESLALVQQKSKRIGDQLNAETTEKRQEIEAKRSNGRAVIEDWYQAELEKLQQARQARVDAVEAEARESLTTLEADHRAAEKEALDPLNLEAGSIHTTIENLERKHADSAKLAGQRKQIEEWKNELQKRKDELESIDIANDQLDRLRTKKLAEIELDGMEIKGGRLYVNGVLSSKVNTAQRYLKWVEIATMFSTAKGQLLIIDELEALEPANAKLLEDALRGAGLQLVGAMRTEGPLMVSDTLVPAV